MEIIVAQQPSHFEHGKSNTQGLVVWLYGLSGSGKSTLANLLNERLKQEGHRTLMLDGDSLRATINSDLGFADEMHQALGFPKNLWPSLNLWEIPFLPPKQPA
jgi:adenylylsulfate kinase-like enzyme